MQTKKIAFTVITYLSLSPCLKATFPFYFLFPCIYPWLSPVATATKFETKRAITRFLQKISQRSLRLTGGFGGQAIIGWSQCNYTTTVHCCHGNEMWDKIC